MRSNESFKNLSNALFLMKFPLFVVELGYKKQTNAAFQATKKQFLVNWDYIRNSNDFKTIHLSVYYMVQINM